MKKDFSPLINSLKEKKLIDEDELVLITNTQLNGWALMFGAIGGAIAGSQVAYYTVSISNKGLKLFGLDRKTFEYDNAMIELPYTQLKKLRIGTLGGLSLKFKSDKISLSLQANNKVYGFNQKEEIKKAIPLLKEHKI